MPSYCRPWRGVGGWATRFFNHGVPSSLGLFDGGSYPPPWLQSSSWELSTFDFEFWSLWFWQIWICPREQKHMKFIWNSKSEVNRVGWWMSRYGGSSPKRQYAYANATAIRKLDVGWRRMSKEKLQTAVHYRSKGGKRCWTGSKHLKSTEYLCSKCGFYFKNILEPRIPFFFGVWASLIYFSPIDSKGTSIAIWTGHCQPIRPVDRHQDAPAFDSVWVSIWDSDTPPDASRLLERAFRWCWPWTGVCIFTRV